MEGQKDTLKMRYPKLLRFGIGLIIAMHFFGFWGLQWELTRTLFELLTPLNLLVSVGFLFFFQESKDKSFWLFSLTAVLVGFFAELVGTKTGVIFGEYTYDDGLGFKIFETPPLIGLNWWMLVLSVGIFSTDLLRHSTGRVFLAAGIMTGLDFLIEPFAVKHGLWHWATPDIPFRNYVAWFIIALFLQFLMKKSGFEKKNPVAVPLFLSQLLFFSAHNLVYWFL